ncbi:hypothetical protein R1sor_000044 [Riccia sorocarpa]|uniref:Uncharacterized protein n=1 Tax=Riccia sorocarpa TaxID=122646 RepID=A0ABD3GRY6_9MARC
MPRQSDHVTIGKQLTQLIELHILDSDSTSSSDNDLEMLDLLSIDADSADSADYCCDSDRDKDISDDSDSDRDDDIAHLDALRELTRMAKDSLRFILDLIGDHSVFHNDSSKQQEHVFVQLVVALNCFGHEGNEVCLDRSMLLWGLSHVSMVNYTNRVMIALESYMRYEIAWSDRQE